MSAQRSAAAIKADVVRLFRSLLRNAERFPLKSRRDIVRMEVKAAFRDGKNVLLSASELEYKLVLGWERNAAVAKYAENMHWFHSRDEVTPQMLHYSQQRDQERVKEAERCNAIGDVRHASPEVHEFKSVMYHTHPDYFNKVEKNPLVHPQDVWRARGNYGSETGGPRQRFFVKRYKAVFPQGW